MKPEAHPEERGARRLRVVMLSQKVDAGDWLQAFTVDWIRALAAQVQKLDVIALEMHGADFPANVTVHSLGKERGISRPVAFVRFLRRVRQLAPSADVFFAHLVPRYTWLAAPVASAYHVPQSLWYTHNHAGPELRLALRCVRWVTTAVPGSFPIPSPKVHALGHGIDSNRFAPDPYPVRREQSLPLVLAVGRIARIKNHDTLIEAAALLRDQGVRARFAIAGSPATADGEVYQRELEARIAALGLGEMFTLLGPLRGDALITTLREAAIVTNLSPVGLFDKAALEGMMVGCPVIVTNSAFDPLLGAYQRLLRAGAPDDPRLVAEAIRAVLALDPLARAAIGRELRARAIEEHSLTRLMERMTALWSTGNGQ